MRTDGTQARVFAASLLLCPVMAWSATGVRLEPPRIALASSTASQHYVVSALDSTGIERDVGSSCKISSSDPNVVQIDEKHHLMIGKSPGHAQVRAEFSGAVSVAEVTVGDKASDMNVRFSPDIISILTTKGCNGSGCHGSPAGQNGFKLSLFGYNLEADYDMIVKAANGRRVDLLKPDNSLILRKPSFKTPHGGGKVLPEDSQEYKTILAWLQQGAKVETGGARLTKLEVYPKERILTGPGATQSLVLLGELSDGSTRDMTREVRYTTGDESVATVSPEGVVTSGGRGLTSVLARAMGQVAAAQIGVITEQASTDFTLPKANNFIDDLAFAKLREMNVSPFPISSDEEFVRRVYLDTIGRLPRYEETVTFVQEKRSDKRVRLIDDLLDRPEYASFWTVKFEDWFRNCQLNSQGRSMGIFKEWIHDWIAEDRPYDRVVREILTSEGDTFLSPATNFWHPATDFMLKKFDVKKITPTVTRLFMGVRLECAECHSHPLENLTQDDFYGIAAFFGRMQVKHGYGEYRRTWYLDDDGEVLHPVTNKPVKPRFLAAGEAAIAPAEDRRTVLAEWIASPKNRYFARATVNRIWHEYFDVGIVEPFDDFRSTNPPSNRELLDRLARYFADSGFRLKALHRIILNSRTYQLSSQDPSRRDGSGQLERLLFARYQPRKLTAEVLLDSIVDVTEVPHPFKGYPKGTRALDLYVPDLPDYFLVTFGLPRRDVLSDRIKTPTLSQALHLMNGETVQPKIVDQNNILGRMLAGNKSDIEIVDALYMRAYSRQPSDRELEEVNSYLAGEKAAGQSRRAALEGVLWSVLNSKEFQLNH
jgi:hypothetical protein